jgi:error-prone DNA polymerase
VLGFTEDETSRISKLETAWEWREPKDTLENTFRVAGFDLRNRRNRKFLEVCERMQHLPRNLAQHNGGMVICQEQLDSVVPIERHRWPGVPSPSGTRTTAQTWESSSSICFGMMAVLADCLELVPKHYGVMLDYAQIPTWQTVFLLQQPVFFHAVDERPAAYIEILCGVRLVSIEAF